MTHSIIIREFEDEDLDNVVYSGIQMHQESPEFRALPFKPEKCVDLFQNILVRDDFVGLIAEINNEFAGMFVGYTTDHFFSDSRLSGDLLLYVPPKMRATGAAEALLRHYVEWAKGQGAARIRLGVTTGLDPKLVRRLYGKVGFEPVGELFRLKG